MCIRDRRRNRRLAPKPRANVGVLFHRPRRQLRRTHGAPAQRRRHRRRCFPRGAAAFDQRAAGQDHRARERRRPASTGRARRCGGARRTRGGRRRSIRPPRGERATPDVVEQTRDRIRPRRGVAGAAGPVRTRDVGACGDDLDPVRSARQPDRDGRAAAATIRAANAGSVPRNAFRACAALKAS